MPSKQSLEFTDNKLQDADETDNRIRNITQSKIFKISIACVLCLNAVSLAVETDRRKKGADGGMFIGFNVVFIAVYTMEFTLRLYPESRQFWKNAFNVFDFLVLILAYIHLILESIMYHYHGVHSQLLVVRLLRALQTLRTLRIVSFLRGLQVLVKSLLQAIRKWMLAIAVLVCSTMFLFAIVGYFLFGYEEGREAENWASLERAMITLFCYVTLDGWTDEEEKLEEAGYSLTGRLYTIVFILLGHYIMLNVVMAVIIMSVSEDAERFKTEKRKQKEDIIHRKKDFMLKKQHEEVVQFTKRQHPAVAFRAGEPISRGHRGSSSEGTWNLTGNAYSTELPRALVCATVSVFALACNNILNINTVTTAIIGVEHLAFSMFSAKRRRLLCDLSARDKYIKPRLPFSAAAHCPDHP